MTAYNVGRVEPSRGLTPEAIEQANANHRGLLRAKLGGAPPSRGVSEDSIRHALREWIEPLYGDGRAPVGGRDAGDLLFAVVAAMVERGVSGKAEIVGRELAAAAGHFATSRSTDADTARFMVAVAALHVERARAAHHGHELAALPSRAFPQGRPADTEEKGAAA